TRSRSSGDYLRAIELDKEATALDPDFANAYVAIASNVQYAGLPRGGGVPGIERAYRLRDSLNARERWVVEAYYHRDVTGDWTKAIAAFQEHFTALKQIGETGFTADVAAALELDGELAAADQVIQDGNVFIGPQNPGNQLTHVPVLHALGKDAEAHRVLEEFARRSRDRAQHPGTLRLRVGFLADSGGYEAAHALAAGIRRASSLINDLRIQAELDAVRGRFNEAVEHLRGLKDQALVLGEHGAAVEIAIAAARLRMLAGDSAAVSEVDEMLASNMLDSAYVLSRPYLPLVLFYAAASQPRQARAWLTRYQREVPVRYQGPDRWMLHRARAATYRAEGNTAQA